MKEIFYELAGDKLSFFLQIGGRQIWVFLVNWQEMNVGFYGLAGDKFRFSHESPGDERSSVFS
jgi:hypothetical protein